VLDIDASSWLFYTKICLCLLLEVVRGGGRFFALSCLIFMDVELILDILGIVPCKRYILFADKICWSEISM
jgi:hypothetical protein